MPKRPTPFGSATLVDAKELASFLGCSEKNVRRLTDKGQIPKAVKVGKLLRWSRQTIEDWLASQA
jgi:excisionase family DNA binding protein